MEFLKLKDMSSQTGISIEPLVNKTKFNHTKDHHQNTEDTRNFLEASWEEVVIDFYAIAENQNIRIFNNHIRNQKAMGKALKFFLRKIISELEFDTQLDYQIKCNRK